MEMDDMREEAGPAQDQRPPTCWWPSNSVDTFGSVSLDAKDETQRNEVLTDSEVYDSVLCQTASQILWKTGMLSEPIPNGFYSVIPERRLKELFDDIPTFDELRSLELEGIRADVILVDGKKDKKLSMIKQLTVALVKGLNSNPAAKIKKIARLVSDFYKRPNSELSPAKAPVDETSHVSDSHGIQMLGQIKHGSCRPRAILFKFLADAVGLESRLVVGLSTEGDSECIDSYKHMSVLVVLNSVELLVDLLRCPGQLIPQSAKAIFMTHLSAAGESDSAENDSCDSPLEPNSPLYGVSEKADLESVYKDDALQYKQQLEATSNAAGPSLRNMILRSSTLIDRKMSPEHPSFRGRSQSMLSGGQNTYQDYSKTVDMPRSEGASMSEVRRIRRSISITPEIGDDIVRAVRAMNESLKQNCILKEQQESRPLPGASIDKDGASALHNGASDFHTDDRGVILGGHASLFPFKREFMSSQKSVSLPSSPHDFGSETPEGSKASDLRVHEEMVSTWNRILESSVFQNKSLLPFEEWNINFSELTVGSRVGLGFFGEVFRGFWNGTEVAIKVFLEQDLTAENMEDFCNEISILRCLFLTVILFLGACTKPPHLSMVTEYMDMGSLYYLIHLSGQKKLLSWRRRLKMLCDICRGLMCIHRMKIVHRDLKSANCLVNKHWTVKICDFGLSRLMTDAPVRDITSAGTPEWMAPELIRNEPFTEKCDIFSLGVIIWELYTLNRPWEGVPPQRVVYAVANEGARPEIPEPEGPLGRLIADCWSEPHVRPGCEEILKRLHSLS
nr:serine/threonine-protein kinase EDR1-like isoform X1 [Ipomoea batatas]